MADDSGFDLLLAAALDVFLDEESKKHKWARWIKGVVASLFFVLIGLVAFITFWYS